MVYTNYGDDWGMVYYSHIIQSFFQKNPGTHSTMSWRPAHGARIDLQLISGRPTLFTHSHISCCEQWYDLVQMLNEYWYMQYLIFDIDKYINDMVHIFATLPYLSYQSLCHTSKFVLQIMKIGYLKLNMYTYAKNYTSVQMTYSLYSIL